MECILGGHGQEATKREMSAVSIAKVCREGVLNIWKIRYSMYLGGFLAGGN